MKIEIGKKTQIIMVLLLFIGAASAISEYGNNINIPGNIDAIFGNFTQVRGNGSGLTNLNASNATGVLPNASIPLSAANLSENNTFTGTGSTSFAGNVTAKRIGGVIYADQYGYTSTGLNNAINASLGVGKVSLGCGVWNVTDNVRLSYSPIEFEGSGDCTVLRLDNLSKLRNQFAVMENRGNYNPGEPSLGDDFGVYVHDFLIDVNGNNQTPNFGGIWGENIGAGLKLNNCNNCTVERVSIRNDIAGGIMMYAGSIPSTGNRVLYNNIQDGGIKASTPNGIVAGILVDDSSSGGTLVFGNHVRNESLYAYMTEDTGRGSVTFQSNTANNTYGCYKEISSNVQNTFKDNTCDTTTTDAIIHGGSIGYPRIESNYIIRSGGYGIKASYMSLKNNKIWYSAASGIYIEASDVNAEGNEIISSGQNISYLHRDGITINLSSGNKGNIWLNNNQMWDDYVYGRNPLSGGAYATQKYGLNIYDTTGANNIAYFQLVGNRFQYNNVSSTNLTLSKFNPTTQIIIEGNSGIIYNYNNGRADWGVSTTAPTAFGAGDTYFNSAAGYPCWRNATSWNRYNDSVGGC